MDVFPRTFLPAAVAKRIDSRAANRHIPVVQRCVERDDTAVLMARCTRPDRPLAGEFLLLLTRRRLVVTQESRILHRLRLHLNATLRHLSDVTCSADERQSTLEIAVTAVDGVRERFLIKLTSAEQVLETEDRLKQVFRDRTTRRRVALAA